MANTTVEKTSSEKFNDFLEKHKRGIIVCTVVILVLLIAFIVFEIARAKSTEKNLSLVDAISYELTDGSLGLEDEETEARLNAALEKLSPLVKKGGVAGVRANLLAAEVAYQQKNYADAAAYWDVAAKKGKKSYTAPLAYYNRASALEEAGDFEGAASAYKAAADFEGFVLSTHAQFSYGRVLEETGDFSGAVQAYTKLNDTNPGDIWANLAKTRILALQIEGKAE